MHRSSHDVEHGGLVKVFFERVGRVKALRRRKDRINHAERYAVFKLSRACCLVKHFVRLGVPCVDKHEGATHHAHGCERLIKRIAQPDPGNLFLKRLLALVVVALDFNPRPQHFIGACLNAQANERVLRKLLQNAVANEADKA